MRSIAWLGLFFVIASCRPSPHQTLVVSGQKAEKEKRWVDAALAYAKACQLAPTSKASCDRAKTIRDYAVKRHIYEAGQYCDQGDLTQCLSAVAPVRIFNKTHQGEIASLIEKAGILAEKKCSINPPKRTDLPSALKEVRCLQKNREALWSSKLFRSLFGRRTMEVKTTLVDRAVRDNGRKPGASATYWQAANCLAPLSSQEIQQKEDANIQFLSQTKTLLSVEYTANGTTRAAKGTCVELASRLGIGLYCDTAAAPSRHHLSLQAEIFSLQPRWERSHSDISKNLRYKAGTRSYPNPEYHRLKTEYKMADRNFRAAEHDAEAAKRRCDNSQEAYHCKSYRDADSTQDRLKRERDRTRREFRNTPLTLSEDVMRNHRYVTRTHKWVAPLRATIKLEDQPVRTEITEIVYTDTEQEGFAAAGIPQDSFQKPGPQFFRDQSGRWLMDRFESYIHKEMTHRAKAWIKTCNAGPVECWATAARWNGESKLGVKLLSILGEHAEQTEDAVIYCTEHLFE